MVTTFVIDSDPEVTARMLDNARLGKQRVEAAQIVTALTMGGGYSNHPATKMWVGYVEALKVYTNVMITEWITRGKNNTMSLYDISSSSGRSALSEEAESLSNAFSGMGLSSGASYISGVSSLPNSNSSHSSSFDTSNVDITIRGVRFPPWWNSVRVHNSHKAALLRKDPTYYTERLSVPDEYLPRGYIWPHKWSVEQLNTLPLEQLTDPAVTIEFCTAIKGDGDRCKNKIKNGDRCGVHTPKGFAPTTCLGTYKSGLSCTLIGKYDGYCGRHKRS